MLRLPHSMVILAVALALGALGCGQREPASETPPRAAPRVADEVAASGKLRAGGAIADPGAFVGTSSPEDSEPAVRPVARPEPTPAPPHTPGPEPPGEPPSQPPTSAPATPDVTVVEPLQVYVAAVVGSGSRMRVLVVHRESGQRRWVAVGETAFGYRVDMATLKGAVLSKDGREYVVELGEGRPEDAGARTDRSDEPEPDPETGEPESSGGSEEAKFHGRWRGTSDGQTLEIVFNPGGTGQLRPIGGPDADMSIDIDWRPSGGQLHLAMRMGDESNDEVLGYRFEDGDRTLVLMPPGDDAVRLTKQ
ncbi:MAG: hypothetical protein GF320_08885 [Armatimonadia bacterium]|nr:hypothetical protein [Armatimonadia bacterium]